MAKKRILMLVGDFVEDYEAMVPLQIMRMVGHECMVACPGKNADDVVATAIHDFDGFQTYSEKRGHNLAINVNWLGVDESQCHGLVIPGGRSPEYLQLDRRVLEIVRHFAAEGKAIAATCHAGYLLAAADVVRGRRVQAYPTLEGELTRAGAEWEAPNKTLTSVTVDGNLVTAPAWPANPAWMREFLRVLDGK